jgi:hypothetical protein
MGKYWMKIGFTALGIGLIGIGLVMAARRGTAYIESASDLTIPLGSFVPFKLDGVKAGSIRSLSIQRSSPKDITGFRLSVRVTDSVAYNRLAGCKVSIDDVQHLNDRSTFRCLADTTGYATFGELTFRYQVDGDTRESTAPLLLPDQAVRDIRSHATTGDVSPGFADSLAKAVRSEVQGQARFFADSIRAEKLQKAADRMTRSAEGLQAQADSIRANSRAPAAPAPPAKKPPIP